MTNKIKKYAAIGLMSVLSFSISSYAATETAPTNQVQDMPIEQQLAYLAQNKNETVIKRAEALRQLARYPNQNSLVAVARGLKDPSPVIREAAITGSKLYKFEHRWRMLTPLLNDAEFNVRMAATVNLLRNYQTMNVDQKHNFEASYQDFVAYLQRQPDQQLLLADAYRWHGEWKEAEVIYQRLVKIDPKNSQIWLNLSDNYRAQDQDEKALVVLNNAIKQLPQEASLYYAIALTQVRLNQKKSAAESMTIATTLADNNSYYWYLNGVLHQDFDLTVAIASFEKAYLISGSPEQLYALCDIYIRHGNEKANACITELEKLAPESVIKQLKHNRKE
ncbi:HEAT repeat domain-containing protein [Photobacterium carnosum]|uniref:HEAT repeat domain-containing protein n=1 Tax=Photobacterium carnosum TaxID=2023717 RepID=UPI001E40390E